MQRTGLQVFTILLEPGGIKKSLDWLGVFSKYLTISNFKKSPSQSACIVLKKVYHASSFTAGRSGEISLSVIVAVEGMPWSELAERGTCERLAEGVVPR